MPDLGTISRFLAAVSGLWDRAEQYLPLILVIASGHCTAFGGLGVHLQHVAGIFPRWL